MSCVEASRAGAMEADEQAGGQRPQGQQSESNKAAHLKAFQNAVKKERIIHKIQVLQEEKDLVPESGEALDRASAGVAGMRERFGRAKAAGRALEDPLDMVPAEDFADIEAAADLASSSEDRNQMQSPSAQAHAHPPSPKGLPPRSASTGTAPS